MSLLLLLVLVLGLLVLVLVLGLLVMVLLLLLLLLLVVVVVLHSPCVHSMVGVWISCTTHVPHCRHLHRSLLVRAPVSTAG